MIPRIIGSLILNDIASVLIVNKYYLPISRTAVVGSSKNSETKIKTEPTQSLIKKAKALQNVASFEIWYSKSYQGKFDSSLIPTPSTLISSVGIPD